MPAIERNLYGRVTKLEINMDGVLKGIDELKAKIDAMNTRIDALHVRMDSWLKWVLGFIFSSWLTLMVSIWLKK